MIASHVPNRTIPVLVMLLVSLSFGMIACKDDKVTCPQRPLCAFSGITRTDPADHVLSVDPDDWCAGSAQEPGLGPVYPNPASASMVISFSLPDSAYVTLVIIDQNCEIVRTLYSGGKLAGTYPIAWEGSDNSGQRLPADIYRCLFQADEFTCHGDIQLE